MTSARTFGAGERDKRGEVDDDGDARTCMCPCVLCEVLSSV